MTRSCPVVDSASVFPRERTISIKPKRKSQSHGRPGVFLGPAQNYPVNTVRMLDAESGGVVTTHDVVWISHSLAHALKDCTAASSSSPSTERGGNGENEGAGEEQELSKFSCGSACMCSGVYKPREPVEPAGGADSDSDSGRENGVEESKEVPAVKLDPPALESVGPPTPRRRDSYQGTGGRCSSDIWSYTLVNPETAAGQLGYSKRSRVTPSKLCGDCL